MAIGTPSETFVDPLFITYGMLALAVGSSFHAILAATAKARVTLSTR